jgi:DNA replication protein DnaC
VSASLSSSCACRSSPFHSSTSNAIQNGFETLFTTSAELIEDLSNASKRGQLQEALATYTHPHVLVVDEDGYLTYGPDAANVLFHVVNATGT